MFIDLTKIIFQVKMNQNDECDTLFTRSQSLENLLRMKCSSGKKCKNEVALGETNPFQALFYSTNGMCIF